MQQSQKIRRAGRSTGLANLSVDFIARAHLRALSSTSQRAARTQSAHRASTRSTFDRSRSPRTQRARRSTFRALDASVPARRTAGKPTQQCRRANRSSGRAPPPPCPRGHIRCARTTSVPPNAPTRSGAAPSGHTSTAAQGTGRRHGRRLRRSINCSRPARVAAHYARGHAS